MSYLDRFSYKSIPDHMMESMKLYVSDGRPLGGFLEAVFANDLFKATSKADEINIEILPIYVCYIYNELPDGCHGSYEIVDEWIKKHRKAVDVKIEQGDLLK